jgi:hypothetical protein
MNAALLLSITVLWSLSSCSSAVDDRRHDGQLSSDCC